MNDPKHALELEGDPYCQVCAESVRLIEKHPRADISEMVRAEMIDLDITFALAGGRKGTFKDIWMGAMRGDDKALFKLIRVWKQFAGAKWVYNRVREACQKGDLKFLQEYGKALAPSLPILDETLAPRSLLSRAERKDIDERER
ncbi:MAG: hypothetical protein EXS64_12645 [Candidatus Latescibacteria bacterium]|nr:hypothetical protein [Candidatus Latescibacterota bacterium]